MEQELSSKRGDRQRGCPSRWASNMWDPFSTGEGKQEASNSRENKNKTKLSQEKSSEIEPSDSEGVK